MANFVRALLMFSQKVTFHKDDYPYLHQEFENRREKREKGGMFERGVNIPMYVSDEAYSDYLRMIQDHFTLTDFPSNDRLVVVTTHNGGEFTSFRKYGKWWRSTVTGRAYEVPSIVIRWRDRSEGVSGVIS